MPKSRIPAAGEAVAAIDRRKALTTIAAVSATGLAGSAFAVSKVHAAEIRESASGDNVAGKVTTESPSFRRLQDAFKAAVKEHADAIEARDWIADEWRHVWPLAPEDILGGANADGLNYLGDDAERDIAGRFIYRDTMSVPNRLSKQFREPGKKTCFQIETVERLSEFLQRFKDNPPTGRTEKSLARNRKLRAEYMAKLRRQITLARAYEAETARIRKASGIEAANQRIKDAKSAYKNVVGAIAAAQPSNFADLRIMASALAHWNETTLGNGLSHTTLGAVLDFPKAFLSVTEREA